MTSDDKLLLKLWREKRFHNFFAQACVAFIRPLLLLALVRMFGVELANQVGTLFVAVGVGTMLSGFDSGQLFYQRAFKNANGLVYFDYVGRVVIMSTLGLCCVIVMLCCLRIPLGSAAATVAYFITERYIDERQRYYLVARELDSWRALQIQRGLYQFAVLFVLFIFMTTVQGTATATTGMVFLPLALGNVLVAKVVYIFQTSGKLFRRPLLVVWILSRSFQQLRQWLILWPTVLVASFYGYLDRVTVVLEGGEKLAAILLLLGSFGLISIVVNAGWFSMRRRDIVDQLLDNGALLTRGFLCSFIGGTLASAVVAGLSFAALPEGTRPSILIVALCFAIQSMQLLGGILREILFYRKRPVLLLRIDAALLTGALLAMTLLFLLKAGISTALWLIFAAFLTRFIVFLKMNSSGGRAGAGQLP